MAKTYRINEIFYSLQGEGAFTGTPMVFVRFSGCNRACPFCDTEFDRFVTMTAAEILREVMSYDADHVLLTGGEPLLQVDAALTAAFRAAGMLIHVETNGSLPVPPGIDWVTCSPKDGELRIRPESINEIKIVNTGQSLEELIDIRDRFPFTRLFYLQPCSGKNIPETVEMVKMLRDWRLSLQTHKLIDIP